MTRIADKLFKTIGISGRTRSVRIKTVNGETSSSVVIEDLQVANINKATKG